MGARKTRPKVRPNLIRKTVTLDAAKLRRARRFLNAPSDAEVLRLALEHLLSHFEEPPPEEE